LSNSPGPEDPSPIAGSFSISGNSFRRPHSTANDNRLPSAVDSLILVRSFTGTKTCLGHGPRQRRAQWPGYKPGRSVLSTVVVNKSSPHGPDSCGARKSRFRDTAPYLSHNPATFWHYVSIESPDASGGCRRSNSQGSAIIMDPSLFPCSLETSRDLHSIDVRDSGQPFGL
jgi:hypothetical protein